MTAVANIDWVRETVLLLGAGAQAKYSCEILRLRGAPPPTVIARAGSPAMTWPASYGANYLVGTDGLEKLVSAEGVRLATVCAASAAEKRDWLDVARRLKLDLVSLVHPGALVATTATIGAGSIVNGGAVIQPFAVLGQCVMVHAGVIVEHDCNVGDFVNLAPGCRLAGWVRVGEGAAIFTGASVIPSRVIGAGAVVGAGAAVVHDVPEGACVAGVPARVLKSV